jgi:hypothetical protein
MLNGMKTGIRRARAPDVLMTAAVCGVELGTGALNAVGRSVFGTGVLDTGLRTTRHANKKGGGEKDPKKKNKRKGSKRKRRDGGASKRGEESGGRILVVV